MATAIDTSWSSSLSKPASTLKPGEVDESTLGNPADLGGYRGLQQARGQKYDDRADAAYDWGTGARDRLGVLGDQVTQQALDTGRMTSDWAKADRGFWEGTYKPAMQEQMDFARGYTTQGRMDANRAGAMAGVNVAGEAAANKAKQNLQSFGVDPSSGRYAGLDAGLAAKQAATAAAAGTKSDRDTEMLGQEYLDRAIRTGASLPGQAANEAGVSLAAGNAAANTGIAVGQAQRGLTEPSGWVDKGDNALQEWKKSLLEQTALGMQQNRDVEASKAAAAKREEGGSSGIGSLIGMGAGILGSVYGGPIGGMIGSKLGSMAGGAMSGGGGGAFGGSSAGGIFGTAAEHGGLIKKMRAGGAVRDVPEPEDIEEEDEARRNLEHRGYKPGRDRDPQMGGTMPKPRAWREPHSPVPFEMPDSDTEQSLDPDDPSMSMEDQDERNRRQWVPNYADGGGVDSIPDYIPPFAGEYAEGGEVEDEAFMDEMDAEMEAEDPIPEGGDQVVTPDMSPSGGENTDDVHALLNEGEFVIPKEVVRWHGEKFFQKLIQKAHDEIAGPKEAEPEEGPPTAMAIAPPTFRSGGTSMGA